MSKQDDNQPEFSRNNLIPGNQVGGSVSDEFIASYVKLVKRLDILKSLGHSSEIIQKQWQDYYNGLDAHQKRYIWQQAQRLDQQRLNLNRSANNQSQGASSPVKVSDQTDSSNNNQNFSPQYQSQLGQSLQPIVNRNKNKDFNTFVDHTNEDVASVSRSYTNMFPSRLNSSEYVNSFQDRQQASVNKTRIQPVMAPSYYAGAGGTHMNELVPDDNLGHKARNVLHWNSKTALFDTDEKRSIHRQNFKSLLFGLTVAAIIAIAYMFPTIKQRYIIPWIEPIDANASTLQVITPPEGRSIEDSSFKVIIPSLNVTAPVVEGVDPYSGKNNNDSPEEFEKRMQLALRDGVVHYPTTDLPGQEYNGKNRNVVIIGHSSGNVVDPGKYKEIFARLRNLKNNDLIVVNYDSKQYVYKIYEIAIVEPTQVEVLGPAKRDNSLTLITCEPPGTIRQRLVVWAEQINPSPTKNNNPGNPEVDSDEFIIPGNAPSLNDILF